VSTLKTDGALRDWAYRRVNWLLTGVLAFLVLAFVFAVTKHLRVVDRWFEAPWLLAFPAIGALAAYGLWQGVQRQRDWLPYAMTVVIFLAAYLNPGGELLALHDPLLGDHLGSRSPAAIAQLHVLRRRDRGFSGRVDLHRRGVLDLPREGT
jgi:hypothetical protein